jgi:hypothetical protein
MATPQIDRLGTKCQGFSGRTQSFQARPQSVVHDLFESRISRLPHLFQQNRDIVIEAESGPHTSKHNMGDALMSVFGFMQD